MKRKKIRFTELTDRFITRKTIFCFCSQKVVLRGRKTARLKICLRGQVFVRVETSRSHLAWSTDDRNLTDFLVIKTNLSKFCLKCDPSLREIIDRQTLRDERRGAVGIRQFRKQRLNKLTWRVLKQTIRLTFEEKQILV